MTPSSLQGFDASARTPLVENSFLRDLCGEINHLVKKSSEAISKAWPGTSSTSLTEIQSAEMHPAVLL